ncbi:hypothetical protein GCM10010425_50520 [Streptomyces spororaveus]|uniref:Uncharacterized protein n=1 Tax=Streptomyces spororaveus TaxID=284039 RepID=A0ABQ3T2M9_9ACTN|nr:hypothetical protein [Streptomyces spororaveus]GHI74646.1 hypothetical protein Sspor_02070 [Streptomyces spororaveus]
MHARRPRPPVDRGDHTTARQLLTRGRRIFDRAGSHDQTSDDAVPHWRLDVFTSLLGGPPRRRDHSRRKQDAPRAELPATLLRFATHLEIHRGLMPARSGDTAVGTAHAALDDLPSRRLARPPGRRSTGEERRRNCAPKSVWARTSDNLRHIGSRTRTAAS